MRARVGFIEVAAREHRGTAVLVARALGAAQHQHLETVGAVAQHDQRGRATRRCGFGCRAHAVFSCGTRNAPLASIAFTSSRAKPDSSSTASPSRPAARGAPGVPLLLREKRGAGAACIT